MMYIDVIAFDKDNIFSWFKLGSAQDTDLAILLKTSCSEFMWAYAHVPYARECRARRDKSRVWQLGNSLFNGFNVLKDPNVVAYSH
jgi:hypothetical protein